MKKIVSIILVVVLSMSLAACNKQDEAMISPVTFYYRTREIDYYSENGVIATEVIDVKGNIGDYAYILEQYLNGARSSNCTLPFPAGTTLIDCDVSQTLAQVTLSPHLTMLSDSELMIACICLARTLFDVSNVNSVQISAQNSMLNNSPYITINRDNFALWDITRN